MIFLSIFKNLGFCQTLKYKDPDDGQLCDYTVPGFGRSRQVGAGPPTHTQQLFAAAPSAAKTLLTIARRS